jgi:hypothetical protein
MKNPLLNLIFLGLFVCLFVFEAFSQEVVLIIKSLLLVVSSIQIL